MCVYSRIENTQQHIKPPGWMQKDANLCKAIVQCCFTIELELQ